MGNKPTNIASIVVTSLLALTTAILAFQANKIAETANKIAATANTIAEKHYSLYYETNLPHITAILQEQYDDTSETRYEIISIYNDGGPVTTANASLLTLMEIIIDELKSEDDADLVDTYIKLDGYFEHWPLPTGNTQGLIFTQVKGNFSEFQSVSSEFREAGANDGYFAQISLCRILIVDYQAAYSEEPGRHLREYFVVDTLGSWDKPCSEIEGRFALVRETNALAATEKLYPCLGRFNGQQLWEFCKSGLLPKVED
jgi:hypothetical protein